MARTPEEMGGQSGAPSAQQPEIIQVNGQEIIALPDAEFVKNSDLTRDGQDLVIEGPDGSVIVIEGYFTAEPAPLLQSPDGQALTPDLVQSFAHHSPQYAQNATMTDESPVGAIQEVNGKATITRTDGSVETVTLGMPVFEGDVIETEGDGAVNIVFIDETSLALSDNAKLAIDEYVFDPSSQSGTTDVSVLRGLFVFTSGLIGRDDPDDVNIDTPMGSIGIRGTVIAGNINTGDITVIEGAIVLRPISGSELTLATQFETGRFQPSNGTVIFMGKADPAAFSQDFQAVKSVAPNLFTAIDKSVSESNGAESEGGAQQQQNGGSQTNPQDPAQTQGTNTQDPNAAGTESASAEPPPPADSFVDTTFGGTDAGFGDSAGTTSDGATQPLSTTINADAPPPPPPPPPPAGTSPAPATTTTTTLSPPTLPADLVIDRTVVDDDLGIGGLVATVTTPSGLSGLTFSLAGAKINGTPAAAGDFVIVNNGTSAAIRYVGATPLSPTDVLDFGVRATNASGQSLTKGFVVTVDDLMTIQNINAVDSDNGLPAIQIDENTSGNIADLTAVITQDEAPASQSVTWTIVSALSQNSTNVAGNLAINTSFGTANQSQLVMATPLDREAVGNYVDVVVQGQTTDETGETLTFNKTIRVNIGNIDDVAPTIDLDASGAGNNFAAIYTEGQPGVSVVDTDVAITDTDSAAMSQVVITLTNPQDAGESLFITGNPASLNGVNISYDSPTQITLTGASAGIALISGFESVLRQIKYENTSGAPTTGTTRVIDVAVQDAGGNTSATSSTSITVNAVNNAPVLDNSGTPVLTTITEDDSPGTISGDTVTSFVNGTITDPDGAAVDAIAITNLTDTSNGTWQYSDDSGTNWYAITGVNASNAFLMNPPDLIRFVPNADFNGTVSFSYKAWDQSSGSAHTAVATSGNNSLSTASETASISVSAVDDAPSVSANSISSGINEGASITLTTAHLNVTDVDTTNANLVFTIQGLASNGVVRLSGSALAVGNTFTMVDITSGNVTYQHDGTENFTDSFSFDVTDGTTNITGQSVSITITSVNDLPVSTSSTITGSEDTTYYLAAGDFGTYSDPETGTLAEVQVIALPAAGSLEFYNGSTWVAVTANQIITSADLTANFLRFVPAADKSGNGYATFTYKVGDGTGLSAATYTMTVDITANIADIDTITGTAGNDTLTGDDGDNVYNGGGGTDTITAGAGDDTIDGGAGTDTMTGGGGNDIYYVDNAGDAVNEGVSSGTDEIRTNLSTYTLGANVENLTFNGSGSFTGTGNALDNVITGSSTNSNTLSGGAGNDILNGGAASDTLTGGAGSDNIYGNGGDDIINAGDLDIVHGGTGNDMVTLTGTVSNIYIDAGTSPTSDLDVVDFNSASVGTQGVNIFINSITGTATIGTAAYNYTAYATGGAAGYFFGIDGYIGTDNDDIMYTGNYSGGYALVLHGMGGDDIFEISGDNVDIEGGSGNDTVHLLSGTYALDGTNITEVESIISSGTSTITLDVSNAMLDSAGGQTLSVDVDGADALTINFLNSGYGITSGSVGPGSSVTYSDGTRSVIVNFGASWSGSYSASGALGRAADIDLNSLSGVDGFTITDNNGESFAHSVAFVGNNVVFTKAMNNPDDGRVFIMNAGTTPSSVGTLIARNGYFNDSPNGSPTNDINIGGYGDFNGDGVLDYVIGSEFANTGASAGSGNAQIINGADGSVLAELDGLSTLDYAGASVSFIGDINMDGFDDVMIGAPGADQAYLIMGDHYVSPITFDISTADDGKLFNPSVNFGVSPRDTAILHTGSGLFLVHTMSNVVEISAIGADGKSISAGPASFTGTGVSAQSAFTAAGGDSTFLNASTAVDIEVHGNNLYVLSSTTHSSAQGQVTIINLSNPNAPQVVGLYHAPALLGATDLAVNDETGRIVVTKGNQIVVLESNASQVFTTSTATGTAYTNVATEGDYAFVSDGINIRVFDISNPGAATLVDTYSFGTTIQQLYYDDYTDSIVVVSNTQLGVLSFDGISLSLNNSIGHGFTSVSDLSVEDGIIYISDPTTDSLGIFEYNQASGALTQNDVVTDNTYLDQVKTIVTYDGFVYTIGNTGVMSVIDNNHPGMVIDTAPASSQTGRNMAAAGDFNDDGYDDVLVSMPGSDSVALILGGDYARSLDLNDTNTYIQITGIADTDDDINVFGTGDMNGDGISDIAVASDNELHIFFGSRSADPTYSFNAGWGNSDNMTITAAAGFEIIGANFVGDFNGDGLGDIAVAMRDTAGAGDMVSVYVVYGNAGGQLSNDINSNNLLNDPSHAFLMGYQIASGGSNNVNNFEFIISGGGDLNGDGFDDLVLGTPDLDTDLSGSSDGEAIVVYGRETSYATLVRDGDAQDLDGSANGEVIANGNNLSLIGDATPNILTDGDYFGVSMSGGEGNDTLRIGNDQFGRLDGGAGFDTIQIVQTNPDAILDFSNVGREKISNIEGITMSGTSNSETIVLGIDQIFDMMQSDPSGVAKITGEADDIFVIELPEFEDSVGILYDNNLSVFQKGETHLYQFASATDAANSSYESFQFSTGHELWISDAMLGGHVIIAANVVTDNSSDDIDGTLGIIQASGDEQALIGNNNSNGFFNTGTTDTSFFGLDGDDIFHISNGNFDHIDGGLGVNDTLRVEMTSLDLRSFTRDDITRVEFIDIASTNTLILSKQNIINLMDNSDASYLYIDNSSANGNLVIDDMGGGSGTGVSAAAIATALGATLTNSGTAATDGYYSFSGISGGSVLQIDYNLINSGNTDLS